MKIFGSTFRAFSRSIEDHIIASINTHITTTMGQLSEELSQGVSTLSAGLDDISAQLESATSNIDAKIASFKQSLQTGLSQDGANALLDEITKDNAKIKAIKDGLQSLGDGAGALLTTDASAGAPVAPRAPEASQSASTDTADTPSTGTNPGDEQPAGSHE